VLTAVITQYGEVTQAHLVLPHAAHETEVAEPGPSPIAPEIKELAWGGGAFVVFLVLMRLYLFPRLKKGMDARYSLIREGHEGADRARSEAKAEVAGYQAQIAQLKAEAAARVDAARQQVESERQAKLVDVNAGIAERRSGAAAQAAAEREAASSQVGSAVAAVASQVAEMVIGKAPSESSVQAAVDSVMSSGAAR
jgi:F-type H+-transporting ATPase subunit b